MEMIKIHAEALTKVHSVHHEFLTRYNKSAKKIYGFVEGKEDPCFYRGFIDSVLSADWSVELWPTGGKDNDIELYDSLDWGNFNKLQVLFFMDKDLSEFFKEKIPNDINIYITDKYSIENDIINTYTLDRLLTEVCNLDCLPKVEKDVILKQFDDEFDKFRTELVSVMAWIICWKRNGYKPCLNDILMKHLFRINAGQLVNSILPRGAASKEAYIHKQCGIKYDMAIDVSCIIKEFISKQGKYKFIRGKYELWFLIEFAVSIYNNICKISKSVTKKPKINIVLNCANAVVLLAPRVRMPKSLETFLNNTCVKYAASA